MWLQRKAINCLIEHGADINEENDEGETPLFEVCKNINKTIVEILFENGADINKKNKKGETPIFMVKDYGFRERRSIPNTENLIDYLIQHGAKE